MSRQTGGRFGGSVTLLRPDGSQYPGSAVVVDGNDNVWIHAGSIHHMLAAG